MSTSAGSSRERLSMSGARRGLRSAKRKTWYRVYRERMAAGFETCRRCGSREELTMDHLRPSVHGGPLSLDNTTILCRSCNLEKAEQPDPWGLRSLAQEEEVAPPERRWAALVQEEMDAATRVEFPRVFCGYCGERPRRDQATGALRLHGLPDARCPASGLSPEAAEKLRHDLQEAPGE